MDREYLWPDAKEWKRFVDGGHREGLERSLAECGFSPPERRALMRAMKTASEKESYQVIHTLARSIMALQIELDYPAKPLHGDMMDRLPELCACYRQGALASLIFPSKLLTESDEWDIAEMVADFLETEEIVPLSDHRLSVALASAAHDPVMALTDEHWRRWAGSRERKAQLELVLNAAHYLEEEGSFYIPAAGLGDVFGNERRGARMIKALREIGAFEMIKKAVPHKACAIHRLRRDCPSIIHLSGDFAERTDNN